MIREIHYKNFKALRDVTLPLGRFTLIVGANGTGKTTAIKALEMAKIPNEFSWKEFVSMNDFKENKSTIELEIITTNGTEKIEWWFNSSGDFVRDLFPVGQEYSLKRKLIRKEFNNFKVFNFDSGRIAQPVQIRPNIELDENGGNLAGVLLQIQNSEHRVFEKLNAELRSWFPEFDRVAFEIPEDGKISFLLETQNGQYKIKAEDLSDGTRLALAYLTIAYLPNPPKIVAFEEPEKGIHPRLLENIQEAMYRLAYPENYGEKREPVQVIATTHSPYLLDLYKDFPEEVVIASKDEKGVHFERLIDKPHYEEVLQDAPLGEIWYSGVLGGVPANL